MGQHEWCDIVLSHTAKIDRYPISCFLSASPCLCTQRHIYVLCIMCIFACRHHWVSTSVRVCVSQRGSVSVWFVSTRNNTLPWDLLNGHHLSLSAKALGKLLLRLRCFLPAASRNQPPSLLWKKTLQTKMKEDQKKSFFWDRKRRWKRSRMKSDCRLHLQGWRLWCSVVFTVLGGAACGTQNISHMVMTRYIVPTQTNSERHTHT